MTNLTSCHQVVSGSNQKGSLPLMPTTAPKQCRFGDSRVMMMIFLPSRTSISRAGPPNVRTFRLPTTSTSSCRRQECTRKIMVCIKMLVLLASVYRAGLFIVDYNTLERIIVEKLVHIPCAILKVCQTKVDLVDMESQLGLLFHVAKTHQEWFEFADFQWTFAPHSLNKPLISYTLIHPQPTNIILLFTNTGFYFGCWHLLLGGACFIILLFNAWYLCVSRMANEFSFFNNNQSAVMP